MAAVNRDPDCSYAHFWPNEDASIYCIQMQSARERERERESERERERERKREREREGASRYNLETGIAMGELQEFLSDMFFNASAFSRSIPTSFGPYWQIFRSIARPSLRKGRGEIS